MNHQTLALKTILENTPLLAGMNAESYQTLANSSRALHVKKGQFVFLQDDNSEEVFLVCSGVISILLESIDGRRLVINEIRQNDFLGELGVLTTHARSSSALARTDCELLGIPSRIFLKVFNDEPVLARRILEIMSNRLRMSSERESALAFLDAQGRLARLLLQLGQQELEKGYITISQEELAERTGQTRQTVAKALGRWRRAGWLITGRGRILLLDLDSLSRVEHESSYG
jgi:CRP/FNR family cyclic AMP-dependent transcriptional regulator